MSPKPSRHRLRRIKRSHLLILAGILVTVAAGGITYHFLGRSTPEDHLRAAREHLDRGQSEAAIIELKNALQLAPDRAEVRYSLGKLYLARQDFAAAEKELRRAREGGHRAEDLPILLARTLIALRQPRRVLEEIDVPEGATPQQAAPLLALRARAQLLLGDGTGAEQTLGQAEALLPGHAEVLVSRAQMSLSAGQAAVALDFLERAIAADGRRADLWLMKGDLQRLNKQGQAALASYDQALRIEPHNVAAHIAKAVLHLQANALEPAAAELRQAGRIAPDHLMVRYLDALVDFRRGRNAEAQTKVQQVLKAAPDFLPGRLLSGAVNLALGNRNHAIADLNKVLEHLPEHAHARKLLAMAMVGTGQLNEAQELLADSRFGDDLLAQSLQGDIALRKGDFAAARQHLEKAAQLAPQNASLLIELAQSRMGTGDTAGAIEALDKAAELDTTTLHPEALLIQTHLKSGNRAAAMAVVDRLLKERPKDPQVHHLRGMVLLAGGDSNGARASFTEALRLDPAYLPAAARLANLDLKANDPKAARARFEAVVAKDPKNSRAWLALAGLAASRKDDREYLDLLTRARQANPKDPAAYELLARYWLNRRDPEKALVEAKAGLDTTGFAHLHDAMGAAQLMQGNRTGALQTYQQWVKVSPSDPKAHSRLATVQRLTGDRKSALESLDRALALVPESIEILSAKAVTLAEAGRSDEGLRLARSLQHRHARSPAGYVTEGDILAHDGKLAAAAEAYVRAARIANSGMLISRAYQLLHAAGQQSRGDAMIEQWLREHPADVLARHTLAGGLLKAGRIQDAMKHYTHLLNTNPKDVIAANNLAWIYGELKDPRALIQAERAHELAPQNPATLDTLGWILVNNGQPVRGIELLRKALSRSPEAPTIRWHLAASLAKVGQKDRALLELRQLIDSGVEFPQKAEAKTLLQDLSSR